MSLPRVRVLIRRMMGACSALMHGHSGDVESWNFISGRADLSSLERGFYQIWPRLKT